MWDTHCHVPPLLAVRKGIGGCCPGPSWLGPPTLTVLWTRRWGPASSCTGRTVLQAMVPLWPHGVWAGRQYRPPPKLSEDTSV